MSGAAAARPATGVRVARAVLVGGGVAGLGYSGGLLVATVSPGQWLGILLWLAGAVVLHDAVLSPVLLVANRRLRRRGRTVPWSVIATVQVAVVAGAVLTLVVVPEIVAQRVAQLNPTELPFDYGLRLGVMWLVLGTLTAIVCALLVRRARRRAA